MGFIDRQRKRVGVGEDEIRRSPLSALVLALADVLEKNEKKNKTTSVKRLRFFNRTQLDFSIPHFTVSKFLKVIAKPNSRKQEELTG